MVKTNNTEEIQHKTNYKRIAKQIKQAIETTKDFCSQSIFEINFAKFKKVD